MNISTTDKYELVLHNVPMCAVCNKPVDKVESRYRFELAAKHFRVYCHGEMEKGMFDDVTIEDCTSVQFGQAFIDKLPQKQLEQK